MNSVLRSARVWRGVLTVWLPLVKWGLPPGLLRGALFYGGGAVPAALALRAGGYSLSGLLARPGRNLAAALLLFGALMLAVDALRWSAAAAGMATMIPFDLLQALSFSGLVGRLWDGTTGGGPGVLPPMAQVLRHGGGGIIEEWMFRLALFYGALGHPTALQAREAQTTAVQTTALPAPPPTDSPDAPTSRGMIAALPRLLGVSVFFALLHWPAPGVLLLSALLGSLTLGVLLLLRPQFWLIAWLHGLYNLRLLLG